MKFHGEDDSTVTNILLVVSAVLVIIFILSNLMTLETIMKLSKPYNSAIFGFNAKDLEFDFFNPLRSAPVVSLLTPLSV